MFTLKGRTSAELRSRIAAGWAKFYQTWPLLNPEHGGLNKRLRLFNATVSQTVLWCSQSWLDTQEEKRHLQSTQNEMLKQTEGARCGPDEP